MSFPSPMEVTPRLDLVSVHPAPVVRVEVASDDTVRVYFNGGVGLHHRVMETLHSVEVTESPEEVAIAIRIGTPLPANVPLAGMSYPMFTVVTLTSALGNRPIRLA